MRKRRKKEKRYHKMKKTRKWSLVDLRKAKLKKQLTQYPLKMSVCYVWRKRKKNRWKSYLK